MSTAWCPPDPQRIWLRTSGPSYSKSEIQQLLDQAAGSTPSSGSVAQSLQQRGSNLAHWSAGGIECRRLPDLAAVATAQANRRRRHESKEGQRRDSDVRSVEEARSGR